MFHRGEERILGIPSPSGLGSLEETPTEAGQALALGSWTLGTPPPLCFPPPGCLEFSSLSARVLPLRFSCLTGDSKQAGWGQLLDLSWPVQAMPTVGRPASPSSGGEVNAWAQKHLHTLRSTLGNCRHVQVFHPGRSVSLVLAWARTAGLREGRNWQAGGINEERLELGSACGLQASPAHGGQKGVPSGYPYLEGSLDSQLWLCLALPLHCQPKVSEKQRAMELYHPPITATLLLAVPETPVSSRQ